MCVSCDVYFFDPRGRATTLGDPFMSQGWHRHETCFNGINHLTCGLHDLMLVSASLTMCILIHVEFCQRHSCNRKNQSSAQKRIGFDHHRRGLVVGQDSRLLALLFSLVFIHGFSPDVRAMTQRVALISRCFV